MSKPVVSGGSGAAALVVSVILLLCASSASARSLPALARGGAQGAPLTLLAAPLATISPTVSPSISGAAEVDLTLSAHPGTWPGSPSFAYQWLDCDPSDPTSCVAINGATASTYTVGPLDGGFTLEVQVTANDGVGNRGMAASAPTAVATAQAGAAVVESDPAIGPVVGGVTATATDGTWSPTPDNFTTEWLSCTPDLSTCVAVGVKDSNTYTPTTTDVGNVLVFAVFATTGGLDSTVDVSAASDVVAFPPPTITIISPTPGQDVLVPGFVGVSYWCSAPAGMTLSSCTGPVLNGLAYTISSVGPQSVSVVARDADGQAATDAVNFTAVSLPARTPPVPTVTVTSPVSGASYTQGTPLSLSFVCRAELCTATQETGVARSNVYNGSSVQGAAIGGVLDTTALGTHTVTIVAREIIFGDESSTTTVTYSVVAGATLSVGGLGQSSARWHLGRGLPSTKAPTGHAAADGTTFRLTSNYPVTVSFALDRDQPGRVHGSNCVTPTRANRLHKACTRHTADGSFTVSGIDGSSTVHFQGRLDAHHALAAGTYTVTVTAQATGSTTPSGPTTVTVGTLHFTIAK